MKRRDRSASISGQMRPKMLFTNRTGFTNPLVPLVITALSALLVSGWMMYGLGSVPPEILDSNLESSPAEPLLVYCAAGVRPALEQIARQYENEFSVPIQLQYGGSNTLLSQIEAAQSGDCFVAAEESYIQLGREKQLVREAVSLAWQEPVIAVATGNPHAIKQVDDLLRANITTALGNYEQAAIGKVTQALLKNSGHWQRVKQHVTRTGVFHPTVPEVANDVKIGSIDAGIIWDATATNFGIEFVRTPELSKGRSQVQIGVLTSSKHPAKAFHFCRFVGAADRGLKEFAKRGFKPVDSDKWQDNPESVFDNSASDDDELKQTR